MELSGKRVLIVGYGKSGKSAERFLKSKNCECIIFDDAVKKTWKNLCGKFDFAVLSPAIKKESVAIKFISENGVPIITEVELGMLFLKTKNIIAVTGTNGKTTCVSLLEHIFLKSGKRAVACGNNGITLTSVCESVGRNDFVILELSSFMLEKIKNANFAVSCFLNFAPDHLDYHESEEEYFSAKKNIFKFQDKFGVAILNADDSRLKKIETKSHAFYFSTQKKVKGVFVKENDLTFFDGEKEEKLFSKNLIKLLGEFNLSNVCACTLIAKVCGISKNKIKNAVAFFQPVKHRLNEIISKPVRVFNDSKSTNISSTLASLSCFDEKLILILGGSDKGENFDRLFNEIKNKNCFLILTGKTAGKIKSYALKNDYSNYIVVKNFKKAILTALKNAKENDIVLFSPACASFDNFKNFEERGEFFTKIVEKYFAKNKNKKSV